VSKTIPIPEEVLPVLRRCEIEGNRLVIGEQLDRKLYVAVNKVLLALGGVWNRKAKAHLFEGDASDALDAALETGCYFPKQDYQKALGFFQTPHELADYAVTLLLQGIQDLPERKPLDFLEPSAGAGALVRALHRNAQLCYGPEKHTLTAVEIDEGHLPALRECIGWCGTVYQGDFLGWQARHNFHGILMNPPFGKQQDIDHVLHTWQFLGQRGRLVAITSMGWTFRQNRKSVAFRAFVKAYGHWEKLPEGSFKSSGTGVNACIVVLDNIGRLTPHDQG